MSLANSVWRIPGLARWSCDRRGAFLRTPEELFSLLGRNAADSSSLPSLHELVAPRQAPSLFRTLSSLSSGEAEACTLSIGFLHRDGREIELVSRLAMAPDGTISAVSFEAASPRPASPDIIAERDQLHGLLDRMPALVFLLGIDHSLRFCNLSFRRHFGSPGHSPCYQVLSGSREPCPVCPALDAVEANSLSVWDKNLGGDRTFQMFAYPFVDHHGESLALVVGMDISGLKRVQRERLKIERRLERAKKIEAMSALASGVAHEINQPLNALHLYASGLELLLEKKQPLDTEILLARLKLILGEADSIRGIVDQMRALVRQETGQYVGAAEMPRAVRRALALTEAQLSKLSVSVRLSLPEGLPPVKADAVQLEQVLVNLLLNALQAMETGGATPCVISISACQSDNFVELTVADNGPGLLGRDDSVFEPFFSTKESGMGLGLSIVHSLVHSWGGRVACGPSEFGGAAFVVGLPIHTSVKE